MSAVSWSIESLEKLEKTGTLSLHCGFHRLQKVAQVMLACATREVVGSREVGCSEAQ